MPFESCDNSTVPGIDLSSVFLTPERRKNCEILKTFNDDSVEIYKAAIAVLQIKDFPAQQSVVAHCFRELINAIIRSEESLIKQQAIDGLKAIEFIKNGGHSEERIKATVNEIWKQLKTLNNEKSKLFSVFMDRNPKKQQELLSASEEEKEQIIESINNALEPVLEAKNRIDKLRHFDKRFSKLAQPEFDKIVNVLESFVSRLDNAQYLERKEALDGILAKANTRRN